MFDRLKSLPLTIILTILIWMYAESQVTSAPGTAHVTVPDVPISISGPPAVVSRYAFEVEPPVVSVTVAGSRDAIDAVQLRVKYGGGKASGIYAYLDISTDDRSAPISFRRHVRYTLPPGLTLLEAPAEVTYRIADVPNSTSMPATAR